MSSVIAFHHLFTVVFCSSNVLFLFVTATSTWSSEGCQRSTTANTGNTVVCECDHLSSFTVVVSSTILIFVSFNALLSLINSTEIMKCLYV